MKRKRHNRRPPNRHPKRHDSAMYLQSLPVHASSREATNEMGLTDEVLRVRAEIVGRRAGGVGVLASLCLAFLGVLLGAGASYVAGQSNKVEARYAGFEAIKGFEYEEPAGTLNPEPLRVGRVNGRPQTSQKLRSNAGQSLRLREGALKGALRQKIVDEVLNADQAVPSPSRSPSQTSDDETQANAVLPKVAIIIDDVGLSRASFDRLMALPGPLTLSFLPYANNLQTLVDEAQARGDAIMLHLPMEPIGPQNPGPHALTLASSTRQMDRDLLWNLERFSGFTGVNNHMGSKFTMDKTRMARVLRALNKRDLYFLDSVTSADTRVQSAALETGATLLRRDVFLDPEAGVQTVHHQLGQVEEIARRTGYAIAIAHPHQDTINVVGPWLATAQLRGFELVTVDELVAEGLGGANSERDGV